MSDKDMNPELRKQVVGLRGVIRGQVNTKVLPDRFTTTPVEGTPRMLITDNESGVELEISLCDYHGACKAIARFC